jgi:hypothetical protein
MFQQMQGLKRTVVSQKHWNTEGCVPQMPSSVIRNFTVMCIKSSLIYALSKMASIDYDMWFYLATLKVFYVALNARSQMNTASMQIKSYWLV